MQLFTNERRFLPPLPRLCSEQGGVEEAVHDGREDSGVAVRPGSGRALMMWASGSTVPEATAEDTEATAEDTEAWLLKQREDRYLSDVPG